jgi:hypothetical protein
MYLAAIMSVMASEANHVPLRKRVAFVGGNEGCAIRPKSTVL